MSNVLQQLRHSARALLRTPGSSAAVLLLVGAAVAALLTIETAASALRWRPLPFPHADVVGRVLASRFYQVSAWHPLTLGFVIALATLLVVLACLGPARRAAALDPLATLRHE